MQLGEWMENKNKRINDELDAFFSDKDVKDRLNSINVYPIITKILKIDNKLCKMQDRRFTNAEEVEQCLDYYQDIMAKINMKVKFIPSIENFCIFMGWTAKVYKKMLLETSEEIQVNMQMINDYLIENQVSAAQAGLIGVGITKFRQQLAGEHGQGMILQKEQLEEDRKQERIKQPDEIVRELKNMGVNVPKGILVRGKNKK